MGLIAEWIDTAVSEPKDRTTEVIKYEEQKKINKASGPVRQYQKV